MNFAALPRSDSAAFLLLQGNGWREDPEPVAELPPQVQAAYDLLREGWTEVQVRLAIQEQYGRAARPNQAYRKALALLIEEQRAAREHMPELVQAIRMAAIRRGLARGDTGAVAALLRDAEAAAGGSLGEEGATLTIEVLGRGGETPPEGPGVASEAPEGEGGGSDPPPRPRSRRKALPGAS